MVNYMKRTLDPDKLTEFNYTNYDVIRREEVLIARIRIGHTYITHSHILKGEDPPECVSCNEPFTVKHCLSTCSDLQPTRDKYYNAHYMKERFDTIQITSILDFLKEVNLYFKL